MTSVIVTVYWSEVTLYRTSNNNNINQRSFLEIAEFTFFVPPLAIH
jgi:hypothetical protein